ncbi:hypothetical protein F4801DRAFT_601649 [Xylaria longipes]|nr:hypothetical protein F4801DRAFT_601649 [Xylaria longipes]
MVSAVTRDIVTTERLGTAVYWVQNLISTVEFDDAFSKLLYREKKRALQVTHVLEVGPHSALRAHPYVTFYRAIQVDIAQYIFLLSSASMMQPLHYSMLLAYCIVQAFQWLTQHQRELPTLVPVHMENIWVNVSDSIITQGKIRVAAQSKFRSYRGASANIIATHTDSNIPLICLEGLETTFITNSDESVLKKDSGRILFTRFACEPDIDLLSSERLRLHCIYDRPKQLRGALESYISLITIILTFVKEALVFLQKTRPKLPAMSLVSYVAWMEYQDQRLLDGESPVTFDGKFFVVIGRNLIGILCGDVDPLDLMFKDGLAERYYEHMFANEHHAYPCLVHLHLLSFKNPSMRILEIGAGTGGQTIRLLETLSSGGVKKWAQYDYIDVSPKFLEQASIKLRDYANLIELDM